MTGRPPALLAVAAVAGATVALAGMAFAGPAAAAPVTAPSPTGGPERRKLSGDPDRAVDLPASITDLAPAISDLVLSVESLDGSFGVQDQGSSTTVTVAADVLFAFDKATLTPAAQARLEELAVQMRARKAAGRVLVGGHTDAKGTTAYNAALSLARARAVVAALQPRLAGLPVTLVPQGFGSTRPIAKERRPDGSDDPKGRARNRRVTVSFTASPTR